MKNLSCNNMSLKFCGPQPFPRPVIKAVPVVTRSEMNTVPMETYASNKRAKPEVSPGMEPTTETAWTRIVAKLLFTMARVTTLMFRLMWPKPEVVNPYSAWPMTKRLEATLSDIAESLDEEEMDAGSMSLGSYQMVEKKKHGSETASQTSRASTGASSYTKAEPYLTEEDYRMLQESPEMCSSMRSPSMDDQETRSQLRPSLLEVPTGEEQTVQLLPVDSIPTGVERGASIGEARRSEAADSYPRDREVIPDGIHYTTEFPGQQIPSTVSASTHDEGRQQRLCGPHEVSGMWKGDPRTTSGDLQPSSGDQRERGDQSGRSSKWEPTGEPDGTGDPGLRGLQGISELATQQDGPRKEVGQDRELWMADLEQTAGGIEQEEPKGGATGDCSP